MPSVVNQATRSPLYFIQHLDSLEMDAPLTHDHNIRLLPFPISAGRFELAILLPTSQNSTTSESPVN